MVEGTSGVTEEEAVTTVLTVSVVVPDVVIFSVTVLAAGGAEVETGGGTGIGEDSVQVATVTVVVTVVYSKCCLVRSDDGFNILLTASKQTKGIVGSDVVITNWESVSGIAGEILIQLHLPAMRPLTPASRISRART